MRWAILLAAWAGLGWATATPALEEGKPAPAAEARLFDGKAFQLKNYAGQVVLLHFWASWCAPCREEMPALEAYYEKHRAEGLEVLAISMDDPGDETKARDFMRQFSFPAAMARDLRAPGYGRIWRIPLTFVIDRQGILRKDGWSGAPALSRSDLEKTVTPLLESR